MDLGSLNATGGGPGAGGAGAGGNGRIAVFRQNSLAAYSSAPSAYEGYIYVTPTPTHTPTPTPTLAPTPTTQPGWNGNQYHYEGAQAHAVSSVDRPLGTDTFQYDANGNMTERIP